VAANHVFLLEPALDAGIAQQAVARVHRIGQTRPVAITRFFVRDSVEADVQRMQASCNAVASRLYYSSTQ
jgi:SNF2 family DNA or RNA helicase